MASHPGQCTVEAYVREAWYNITEEQYKFICKAYNNNDDLKEYIEYNMCDFDEEEQSWRDYRNSIANTIDEAFPNEKLLIDYYLKYNEL